MAKSKPMRARLTWDEIREIEKSWPKDPDSPGYVDTKKLITHIKYVEHLLEGSPLELLRRGLFACNIPFKEVVCKDAPGEIRIKFADAPDANHAYGWVLGFKDNKFQDQWLTEDHS